MSNDEIRESISTTNKPPDGVGPLQIRCPPGLEQLLGLDVIVVEQQYELAEMICGCETNNSYSVRNGRGRELYRLKEDTGCCVRLCCGKSRPFTAILDDFNGNTVFFERNLACNTICTPCCLNKVTVHTGQGEFLGSVHQRCSICTTKYNIRDSQGNKVLKIFGPLCTTSCCCRAVEFQVCSASSGAEIGKISKQWGGFIKEAFSDADTFFVICPPDLDVKMKAVLIGAALLIDFMFFEQSPAERNNMDGN